MGVLPVCIVNDFIGGRRSFGKSEGRLENQTSKRPNSNWRFALQTTKLANVVLILIDQIWSIEFWTTFLQRSIEK